MSKYSHIYKPISSFNLTHSKQFLAEEYLTFFPDSATAKILSKYRLKVKKTPKGLIVLYKVNEEFTAITEDETILFNGLLLDNKKVIGYTKNEVTTNWLPNPANLTLTFYGVTNNTYREGTTWKDLELNKYIKYKASSLSGIKTTDNNIKGVKPDAVFELEITNPLATPIVTGTGLVTLEETIVETKFEFNI